MGIFVIRFLSFQLNTTVESRQKRYRASQQLGRSDSLDKLQMKKMASDILNWTMEEMQLLMHGVFQVSEGQKLKYQLFAAGYEVLIDLNLSLNGFNRSGQKTSFERLQWIYAKTTRLFAVDFYAW